MPGRRKDRHTKGRTQEMGLWKKVSAQTSLRLRPNVNQKSLYTRRHSCSGVFEDRLHGWRKSARTAFRRVCDPKQYSRLPQRAKKKTHLCNRWGQFLWQRSGRRYRRSADTSKIRDVLSANCKRPFHFLVSIFSLENRTNASFSSFPFVKLTSRTYNSAFLVTNYFVLLLKQHGIKLILTLG